MEEKQGEEEEKKPEEKVNKKAAKKLAQEKLRIQIKKEDFLREQALDELTQQKLKDKWRNALIDVKIPEMQENMKHILHHMERLIEKDNFRKLLFEDERQDLSEKTVLQAQSHRSALDKLYGIYQSRIEDLIQAFNQIVMERKERALEEFKNIEERENQTRENMQTILFLMTQNREQVEHAMNCHIFLKLDDEKSRNTEKYENLRARLEKKMEKRWGEINHTLAEYEKSTKLRRKEYDQLKAKDDADSRIIFQQMKKTHKLFEQLEELKNCSDTCYAPRDKLILISDLREERETFIRIFKTLKFRVTRELDIDKRNLKNLTAKTDTLIKKLKRICRFGEQILTLLKICMKYETEWEKVIPVGESLNPIKGILDLPSHAQRPREDNNRPITSGSNLNLTKDYEVLHKFWRKVGKIHISSLTLTKYIEDLERENSILSETLDAFMGKDELKNCKRK